MKVFNNFLIGLMNLEDWQTIVNVFKRAEPSEFVTKDETSYLIAIYASKQLKKWKWAYRFYNRGKEKMNFTDKFYETIQEISSDLSEEELQKFITRKND